jgi:hypothetical protein
MYRSPEDENASVAFSVVVNVPSVPGLDAALIDIGRSLAEQLCSKMGAARRDVAQVAEGG